MFRHPFFLPVLQTIFLLLLTLAAASAQTEKVLYSFTGALDGANPSGGLVADSAGNLYGTTFDGGTDNAGTVYELMPPVPPSNQWTETVIHSFMHGEGAFPLGELAMDSAGDLYGTTSEGGYIAKCCGVVFELSPPSQPGGLWTGKTLYAFTGTDDGAYPMAGVILDQAGNLYGTTSMGTSPQRSGTVYQLSRSGGVWKETVLHLFSGHPDGGEPYSALVFDSMGNLYGTTRLGGSAAHAGTIFQLSPNGNGSWTENIVRTFRFRDGSEPLAGLVRNSDNTLAGTTVENGPHFSGTAFVVKPPTSPGGVATSKIIYDFDGSTMSGNWPETGLAVGPGNELYGTDTFGGAKHCGTIYKLSPPSGGSGQWTESDLYDFGIPDACEPVARLLLHNDKFYGTTYLGGSFGLGAVFSFKP